MSTISGIMTGNEDEATNHLAVYDEKMKLE